MAGKEITNEEAAEAKIRAALEELLRVIDLKSLFKAKIADFKGKTKEGENFSGSLKMEESEKDAYLMNIRIKIE